MSLRIAYVGVVPPTPGGIAQHGQRVVEALREDGHTVEIVSWSAQYPRLLYPGRRVVAPDEQRPWLRWWSPRSWKRVKRFLGEFDIAVLPWVTPFHAAVIRRLLGSATTSVVIVHNPVPHEWFPFARSLTRWALRRADLMLVHGEANRRSLATILPDGAIRVVGMPPNLRVAATDPPPLPPVRALFLGYVRRYKGVDTAIEAVALLRSQGIDIELTVAGEAWRGATELKELVRRLGVSGKVDLRLEYVPDGEIGGLLAEHHFVVAPYRTATASGVVPLALAAGRPVVSTSVGSLPEVVFEGKNGALARPGDPDDLALAIQRVIDELPSLSGSSRELGHTWQDYVEAIRQFHLGRKAV